MDIKSLMVGDWVQGNPCGQHCDRNNNAYYKIAILDIGNHCWGYSVCGALVELKYDDIFPIPLTPEILEKNGFEYKEKEVGLWGVTTAPHYVRDDVPFEVFCDGEPFAIWFKDPVDIKYIHQLQQALRLCGISKEIGL